jgi:hypothetical protein
MPKIFLIKDRLHQQQLRLQESQNLIQAKNADQLNIDDNSSQQQQRKHHHDNVQEPLSLVAKKRITDDDQHHSESSSLHKNESSKLRWKFSK